VSRRAMLVLVVIAVAAVAFGAYQYVDATTPVSVSIVNETSSRLSGLVLVAGSGARTSVPAVAAGASARVYPQVGGGEDSLELVDARGVKHLVLGYFEGNPNGTVSVAITGASSAGLSGTVDDRTHYSPRGRSVLEPE